ncbi:NAD(P)/FAD-dependent oxidoreductase [Nostoc sp. NMS4]|uniref:NAD(P)/FAD-dependent oxidoreductase n=1 Tax=Nostoc sp. NMS4 TaxID=2815390 RepID=UPI0025D746E5|nr:NAD(P)/FAD-dependent oxidoreductase [Nostoc sp. NMS4]MBN3924692.1 NAD(P)/FAD-dependent oxidoreductase [Nostoc sp. NMS4]
MRSLAHIDQTNDPLPIVILGGGFAGLFAALHLRDLHSGPIILIDQSWSFVFKPLLYELLTSEVKLELISPRYDELLHNSGITFVLGTVEAIDLEQKQVKLNSGLKYSYRHLVLALGSTTSYLGIPGAKEHALSFRTGYDVFALGQHLRNRLQIATQTEDIEERRALLTVAIVGGGASGVEMAATLADLLPTWYIPLGGNPQDIQIVILQRGSEILKESTSDRLRETAQLELQQRTVSVGVLLESEVKAIHPGVVEFERSGQLERLAAATVVWTTGNATHPVIDSLAIAPENRDKHKRLLVKPTLQLPDFPEVFAGGDCAIEPLNPQPATAQVAYQQGAAIAHNIKALINGKSPTPATVNLRGTLMKLGMHESAVEIFDRYEIKGQLGQAIRLATYLELMPTPARNFVNRTGWFTEEILKQIARV